MLHFLFLLGSLFLALSLFIFLLNLNLYLGDDY